MKLEPFEKYWLGRGVREDYNYDLVILRSACPDEDWITPHPAAVTRLASAVAALATLQQDATLVIATISPAQGEQRWAPQELRIGSDAALWIDFVEWEWDDYLLWAVRFDEADRPVEIRRRAFQLPPVKPEYADRLVWAR